MTVVVDDCVEVKMVHCETPEAEIAFPLDAPRYWNPQAASAAPTEEQAA